MAALTNGEKCQKHFCVPRQWGAPVPLCAASTGRSTPGLSTPCFVGTRAIATGTGTSPLGIVNETRRGYLVLHCPNYLVVLLRSAPEPKPHQNIFCVFFLDDTHRFCYKHHTKEFKASFEWDLSKPPLLAGFQNHNLDMLHLTLITSAISSAW